MRAVRASREFLANTTNGRWKLYSVTGATSYLPHTIVQLRRNYPLIANMPQKARITSIAEQEFVGMDQFGRLAGRSSQSQLRSLSIKKRVCPAFCCVLRCFREIGGSRDIHD